MKPLSLSGRDSLCSKSVKRGLFLKKAETLYLDMKVIPESYWLKRIRESLAKLH